MVKLLREFIYRHSNGKTVLMLFILTSLVFVFMWTVTIPKVMGFSSGMKLLDLMHAGYDAEYVITMFETLGANGRHAYLYNQIPADMFYPGLFGITYCLLFVWFLKKINHHESPLFYFSLLPLISGISDYIENIGIITMLKQYPDISEETVSVASTFSTFKSASATFYFFALIVVILMFIVQSIKAKYFNE
jgi:hypothetical protein